MDQEELNQALLSKLIRTKRNQANVWYKLGFVLAPYNRWALEIYLVSKESVKIWNTTSNVPAFALVEYMEYFPPFTHNVVFIMCGKNRLSCSAEVFSLVQSAHIMSHAFSPSLPQVNLLNCQGSDYYSLFDSDNEEVSTRYFNHYMNKLSIYYYYHSYLLFFCFSFYFIFFLIKRQHPWKEFMLPCGSP